MHRNSDKDKSSLSPLARLRAFRVLIENHSSSGTTVASLDGVRGIAILIVIASHSRAFQFAGHGGAGVWLFFVLSAYLLTRPFVGAPSKLFRENALTHYVARRLLRIVPLYYLVVASQYAYQHHKLGRLLQHVTFMRADGHLWSIPQEMLFYIALPGLILLHATVLRNRAAMVAMLVIGAFAAKQWLTGRAFALDGNGKQLAWNLHIFLIGVAACMVAHDKRFQRVLRAAPRIFALTGLVALLAVVFSSKFYVLQAAQLLGLPVRPSILPCWHYTATYAVLSAWVIIIADVQLSRMLGKVLCWAPLRSVGILSYALYLFHPFILKFLRGVGVAPGPLLFASGLSLAYVAALASYQLLEGPLLALGRRPAVHSTKMQPQ